MTLTKNFLVGMAVAVPLMVAAGAVAPVQAAPIVSGSRLNLSNPAISGNVSVFGTTAAPTGLNFAALLGVQPLTVAPSTGTFGALSTSPGSTLTARIQDVTFNSGTTFTGTLVSFLSGIRVGPGLGTPLTFDLTKLVYNPADGDATIEGIFRSGTDSVAGSGRFTSQLDSGPSTWSMTLTAVPTPAVLPAMIGFGIGIVRKRKLAKLAEA
jgi:opacity protein-like surface antigen